MPEKNNTNLNLEVVQNEEGRVVIEHIQREGYAPELRKYDPYSNKRAAITGPRTYARERQDPEGAGYLDPQKTLVEYCNTPGHERYIALISNEHEAERIAIKGSLRKTNILAPFRVNNAADPFSPDDLVKNVIRPYGHLFSDQESAKELDKKLINLSTKIEAFRDTKDDQRGNTKDNLEVKVRNVELPTEIKVDCLLWVGGAKRTISLQVCYRATNAASIGIYFMSSDLIKTMEDDADAMMKNELESDVLSIYPHIEVLPPEKREPDF